MCDPAHMSEHDVDPRIRELCDRVTGKRPRTVIEHILKHGYISTETLQDEYGYTHAPRAARDVREAGVPLETFKVTSTQTGRKIGAYRFADPRKIKRGRIEGRKAFSKDFHDALVARYDARDCLTGERMEPRYLQIDHRVPYEVAGEVSHGQESVEEFMLLDASNQRAKSWSCEQCPNWLVKHDVETCRTCFWAFPESYNHIAGEEIRRAIVEWRGAEISIFEKFRQRAELKGITVSALLKERATEAG